MARKVKKVLETYFFPDGSVAETVTRFTSPRALSSVIITVTRDAEGGAAFRRGTVPTRFGFVRVWAWPSRTVYEIILGGGTYVREDKHHAGTDRALAITAGVFARRAAELDGRDVWGVR